MNKNLVGLTDRLTFRIPYSVNGMKQNRRSQRLHDCFQKNVVTQKSANAKSTMGSKTPSSKAKVISRCDVCHMKFQTLQALRSHQNVQHPSDPIKGDSSPDTRPKATPKNNTSTAAPSSRVSKRLRLLKSRDKDTEESENSDDQTMEEKQNKIEFSCPKCEKMFPIYFKALKHIQKKHCEDVDGNPVSPDSPAIIKPVSIETCSNCSKSIDSSHDCDSPKEEMLDQYSNIIYCLGCNEQIRSIGNFNKHATHFHRRESDNMFFKTIEEFKIWKQVLETQVKVKYLTLNNTGWQKFYQCNYVSPKNEFNKTYLCPSIIEVKELSAGIQTYYSKEHHGHITPEYELPEEFHHYLTNKREASSDFDVLINKNPDDDLYIQFKDLMDNICTDAKTITISHLRKLFNSALEMQGLLNSYDEEHDDKDSLLISKSMTDDQITDALEGKRSSARLKRKSVSITPVEAKRKKDDKSEDDSINSKSKKDENDKAVSKENKELDSPKAKARSSPALVLPTFNDTYKQFLDPGTETTKKSKSKAKEIVKTKMGQFSPKKKLLTKETVENSKPNILKPSKLNTSFGKDMKYEVRERENDCNILILKI